MTQIEIFFSIMLVISIIGVILVLISNRRSKPHKK